MKQMFQKAVTSMDFDMIIGQASSIEGDLKSGGSVRIDGHVNGNVLAEGDVIIGVGADVLGDIKAANIEVSGTVEGKIHSDGCLKIHSTGILRGDIEVMSFVIDEGGAFEGLCNINTAGLSPSRRKDNDSKKTSTTNDTPSSSSASSNENKDSDSKDKSNNNNNNNNNNNRNNKQNSPQQKNGEQRSA